MGVLLPQGAVGRVPGVLADQQADTLPIEVKRQRQLAGAEVSTFVEHVVGRQEALVKALRNAATEHQGSGVVEHP